ncbi:hypothetical protein J4526_09720 [Desulfurococcaceae archaeon MEX13E-LK6-19]|nr:hypothetical protein J4526_09720 [Desulfurococcaceae archaeon MEX13E-LK6-19]
MSSVAASALRHLEKILDKVRHNFVKASKNPPKLLEFLMVKAVRMGVSIENKFVLIVRKLTLYLDVLQRSLYRSTLLASLWIGLLFTMALLIVALLTMTGGKLWP